MKLKFFFRNKLINLSIHWFSTKFNKKKSVTSFSTIRIFRSSRVPSKEWLWSVCTCTATSCSSCTKEPLIRLLRTPWKPSMCHVSLQPMPLPWLSSLSSEQLAMCVQGPEGMASEMAGCCGRVGCLGGTRGLSGHSGMRIRKRNRRVWRGRRGRSGRMDYGSCDDSDSCHHHHHGRHRHVVLQGSQTSGKKSAG